MGAHKTALPLSLPLALGKGRCVWVKFFFFFFFCHCYTVTLEFFSCNKDKEITQIGVSVVLLVPKCTS